MSKCFGKKKFGGDAGNQILQMRQLTRLVVLVLSAYDEISRHGKLLLIMRMTIYLVMAGSHRVVLDRCDMLISRE